MEIYDQFLKTKIQAFMTEEEEKNRHEKKTFWASESEKPLFDIYHAFIGTPPTNPFDAEKLVMFSAGKMMELAFVSTLQKMGIARNGEQQHFNIIRENIPISGYTDIIFTDGTIGEIKTIYGNYAERDLDAGRPSTAYLKQLAIYLDAHNQERGKLIYLDRGTGRMWEFTLNRIADTKYKCLNVEFDLSDIYKRWSELFDNNIIPKAEPSPFECGKYKEDIEKIDWSKVSKATISKARTNQRVIGSDMVNQWKILYSPYKNLIIERQGATLGYTDAEIKRIKELTKNYSKY